MSASRKILLGVLAFVGVVAAFWFVALAPKSEERARLQSEIDSTQAATDQTRTQVASLRTAQGAYATNYASVARLGKAVPADDDMRSLIVQLDAAARRSAVDFSSIELTGAAAAAPATPTATTSAAASQTATAALPPGATVGPAGLPTMPFSFKFGGSFFTLSDFFARVERFVRAKNEQIDVFGRLLAIDGFSLDPGEEGFPAVTASIGATAYLVPEEQGAMGGGTPTGPTPGVAGTAGTATPASTTAPGATAVPTALTTFGGSR